MYYTRYGNPLHERVAALVAGLEGAESGLCFASGMAAISTVMVGLLQAGDHVVAQANHYMGTSLLLTEVLPRLGVTATLVDQRDTDAFIAAIRPGTRLVHLETPANPTLALTDIAAVADAAHRAGALVTVDNTVASPMNQTPIQLGADIVMHSATKTLGGHHDLTAGVVVGSRAHCDRVWRTAVVLGATLSPMDAWLLLRGLRTLAVRTERQNASAQQVAEFLASHREVRVVHYPGLQTHPQHQRAAAQMLGFGALMALELRGGYDAAERLLARLRLFTHAVSLGGVDSLAVHAAAMWSGTLDEGQMRAAAIEPSLVRLSVGLESSRRAVRRPRPSPRPKESVTMTTANPQWTGRFPANEIIGLLDNFPRHNLGESTSQDLVLGELLDLIGLEEIRDLRLGYVSAAGTAGRSGIRSRRLTGAPAETILTTQGVGLALFLLAFEHCRAGDEAVVAHPVLSAESRRVGRRRGPRPLGALGLRRGLSGRRGHGRRTLSPRTKLVSIASPQNPSGVRVRESEVAQLLEAMSERAPQALLLIDEIYRDATYGDARAFLTASRRATRASSPRAPSPRRTAPPGCGSAG